MEEGLYALLLALFFLFAPSNDGNNTVAGDDLRDAPNTPSQSAPSISAPVANTPPLEISGSPGSPANRNEQPGTAAPAEPSEEPTVSLQTPNQAASNSPAVPTPALLPAFLGFSAQLMRKKQQRRTATTEQNPGRAQVLS